MLHWIPGAGGSDGFGIKNRVRFAAITGVDIFLNVVPLFLLNGDIGSSVTDKYTGSASHPSPNTIYCGPFLSTVVSASPCTLKTLPHPRRTVGIDEENIRSHRRASGFELEFHYGT